MIRRASMPFARRARLLAILALAGAAATPAHAQLSPLIVNVTSPSQGATVSNTITVTATVNPLGALLGGVQFRLDGTDLGAEDMSAPYSVTWNTLGVANGTHTLRATARNLLGIQFTSNPVTVTVQNDATAPTVSISAPAQGANVSGTITVSASASDNVGVAGVQFRLDGAALGGEDTSAPYSTSWNTSGASSGAHTLTAVARDAAGNSTTSASVTVTVGDAAPPSVSITAPAAGSTVSGTVAVTASASDNVGVAGVQFRLDGAALGAEDTTPPYSTSWNTSGATAGNHTLSAIARDAAGNTTTSAGVTVNVQDNVPPSVAVTAPAAGSTVSGTVAVTASASDNVGVAGVQFRLDGAALGAEDTSAPYSTSWNTSGAAPGNHALSAIARDAAGNTTTSASVTVAVGDANPPSVSLTAPAAGATVTGNVTVSADASDNVGVAGVQFRLDGANLGAEDTAAPYSITWQTTTAANGPHTLTAVARDTGGSTTTSAGVSVTVSNSGFASGDVFVAIVDGTVQWRGADGALKGTLTSPHDGQASSAAMDAQGRLYVPHWWGRAPGAPGNVVVRFDGSGSFLGPFGSGYNSNPSSITFDSAGHVYVGQADDSGDILKFDASGALMASFNVATFNRGTDHIDLGADGCTMFYTSRTLDVLRYDVCTNTQLAKLNVQPLPGEAAYHIRVLPDGGLLVADSHLVVRLDAAGNQIQSYFAPGESNYWGGVDSAGDGTFWATNAFNGNVYRFNLETGAILASFNTGTGNFTVAGVAVKP